jgi:hypothetical protein
MMRDTRILTQGLCKSRYDRQKESKVIDFDQKSMLVVFFRGKEWEFANYTQSASHKCNT